MSPDRQLLPTFWVMLALQCSLAAATNPPTVAALGKLQPQGGVTRVAVPYSLQGPSLVAVLAVQVGQSVTNQQLLARTHTYPSATAAWAQAKAEVAVRQARLAVVESGLKPGEVAALAALAERDRADFAEAVQRWTRSQRLRQEGAISTEEFDAAAARWRVASNQVQAATQRHTAGAEVRPVEVALARAELAAAETAAERARQELEQTEVRAPFAGEVLALHARQGEVAVNGLLDLGRTEAMEVKAEVYESDIRAVSPNQKAEITGEAFAGTLGARVTEIGWQVRPNRLLNPDPAAFADNRVLEVTLRLDDSRAVARLSGALVRVRFLP